MTDLLVARFQMALSLAFHIIFAAIGIAMPLLMVIAEWRWLRTGDNVYLTLTKHWAKGTAIFFAIGAVSGTVLSFELGLLWPGFMQYAGSIIGMPFSLEGFAFFTEAIFLGIYLYGWNRVSQRIHLTSGLLVALSGMLSGMFVVTANGWMNTPTGFTLVDGKPVNIDPIAAMLNPAALHEVLHMTIGAYQATAAAVAAIHAYLLLRDRTNRFHRKALSIALVVLAITSVLQIFAGDFAARRVAQLQPAKLAALEGQFETEQGAPLRIGGLPDPENGTTRYALEIPKLLSLLAFHDPNATVIGLNEFPRDEWPNTIVVHTAFQVMVGCGSALLGLGLLSAILAWRRRALPDSRWFLRLVVLAGPLGFIAIEAGWTVTEVGRQPWIIYGIMRTADALTPMPGLLAPFLSIMLIYLLLALIVIWIFWRQVARSRFVEAAETT